ncbi:MAG: class I SAM-dependent methyltransferase [Candidatus Cloacimonetes bacterium]|nr:class I SAM-dependent methyltransferase [Candidatus Cloacimonadota bacterium]HPM02458.1 class I SAM-dependent methyltransferase [Candidatus Cloacimonadota bacterium]
MKTNYHSHDTVYKRLKEKGQNSWSLEEDLRDYLQNLKQILDQYHFTDSLNGKILELGCGAGNILLSVKNDVNDCFGVDISETAIEMAKFNDKKNLCHFFVGDVLSLEDFSDEFFDLVIDGNCFHCIIGEDRASFLNTASRVLKKDGLFYISTMCGDPPSEIQHHYDEKTRCSLLTDGTAVRYFGYPDDIINEIKNSGFHIIGESLQTQEYQQDGLIILAHK